MGQEEVYNYLRKNPRSCTKEVAEALNQSVDNITKVIHRMRDKEIMADCPKEEEKQRILSKWPTTKHLIAAKRLLVYEVIE